MPLMLRVNIQSTYLGQEINNVLGYYAPAIPAGNDAYVAAASAAASAWVARILPLLNTSFRTDQVDVLDMLDQTRGARVSVNENGGTATSEPLASFVTAKVSFNTGRRGRAYQGRTGLSGLTEARTTGNQLSEAFIALLQPAVDGIIGDLFNDADASGLAVISTVSNGAPRPVPIATLILNGVVGTDLGSQNLRKP